MSEIESGGSGRKEPSALKNFLSGGVGGVCTVVTGHPLDTIKVRLQTQPKPLPGEKPLFTGTFNCAYVTVKNEGFRGLYKGMFAPVIGVTPIFAICFFGYGVGKKLQQSSPSDQLTVFQHAKAGMVAGVFTTIFMAPGERIKCLMQIQMHQTSGEAKYTGSIDCAKKLYTEGGIRNVYRGTLATLLRDVPASAFYFGTYEGMLRYLTPIGQSRNQVSAGYVLLAGGTAGITNWLSCIAQDTVKSRYQTAPPGKYNGLVQVFTEIIRTEGPRGLFQGLTPALLRAFPANAACFLGVELSLRLFNWIAPNW